MGSRLNMVRVRKEFLINRVRRQMGGPDTSLVAIASYGNLNSSNKLQLRYALDKVGATVNFTKNTLVSKGLETLGPEFLDLAPLLRAKTLFATGPAEAPLAKELLLLEKTMPDFVVLGALLNSQRILQAPELSRLAKLPPAEQVHMQMVGQMLPGTALQVPNVAAYLVSVLQTRVQSMEQEAGGGGSEA